MRTSEARERIRRAYYIDHKSVHLDGVLHQLTEPQETHPSLDLSHRPHLQDIGNQPVDLSRYEKLLNLRLLESRTAFARKSSQASREDRNGLMARLPSPIAGVRSLQTC